VRRKLNISNRKLQEVLHPDFADCSSLLQVLSGQDAAVFCLGAYTGAVSDAELRRGNRGLHDRVRASSTRQQPQRRFLILERKRRGRSRIAFARYKGEAENALLAAGFPRVHIFRPAYIYPVQRRKEPNFSYRLLRAIYPAFQLLFPNQVIRADDVARAMVDVTLQGTDRGGKIFENRDIRAMVKGLISPQRDAAPLVPGTE
jgi:uncharacterized protein YbjT (DUF2867 family)